MEVLTPSFVDDSIVLLSATKNGLERQAFICYVSSQVKA